MHSFIARAAARQTRLILLAPALACGDSAVSDPPQDGPVGVGAAASDVASLQARAGVHRRNPHDWVGVEHNRMLARFQSELAKPGVLSRNTCDYLLDLATGWQLESAKDVSASARRAAGLAGLETTGLCNAVHTSRLNGTSVAPVSNIRQEEYVLSPEATELTNQVQTAVGYAANSYDLGTRLSPLLDASARLSQIDKEIVQAIISVAQSSYEYWEQEDAAMQAQFFEDYGMCVSEAYENSYSMDEGRDACLNGDLAYTTRPLLPKEASPQLLLRLASVPTPRSCGVGRHFKRLVGADVVGGITGAVGGWKTGVAAGAARGAGLASLGSFLYSTWELYWCAME